MQTVKLDRVIAMTPPHSFTLDVPEKTIAEIKKRVAAFPWHEMPDDGGWEYGVNLNYMREFCTYWVENFDWFKQQDAINRLNHLTTAVDEIDLHFIHEKGSGENAKPLIISHGWPGSVVEFIDFIDLLAHPERHGGNIEDAFDVVAPSLPGFGFSGRPPRPWGPRRMAQTLNSLMTKTLGYNSYIAQGGDWGGAISSFLGFDHAPACRAIHINILTMRHPDGPQTPAEVMWERQFKEDQIMEDGYRTQQATKPQTLSYAMMDSPVGVAAWILEKMNSWSDTVGDDVESVYTKDQLLDQYHGLYSHPHLQHGFLDILWAARRGRENPVAERTPRGGANCLRAVSQGIVELAAAQLRRTPLQHPTMDRNATWRTFRGDGTTRVVGQ